MTRYRYQGRDYRRAITIEDLRLMAQRALPAFSFEYLEGGAEEEITLQRNRSAFHRIGFLPRQLVKVDQVDSRTSLFGRPLSQPLIVSPTGFNGMLWPGADSALARLAAEKGFISVLSTASSDSIEQVAAATAHVPDARRWFQLYMLTQSGITEQLIARAHQAGCEALVLTTDTVCIGNREWDRRNFARPQVLTLRRKLEVLRHPRWMLRTMFPHGLPSFGNIDEYLPPENRTAQGGAHYLSTYMARDLDWHTVDWLRKQWPGKLLLKGILRVDDGEKAIDHGVDGLIISNHGGRQLDGAVSPLEALPGFVERFKGRLPLLLDGGVRRGTDIAKAVALGADAVMGGRALLYGVAAGGAEGAAHAHQILYTELVRTLGQLGCARLDQLCREHLQLPADFAV